MKNIAINYIIHNYVDCDKFDNIVKPISESKKYKITLNVYDFSLKKQSHDYNLENYHNVQYSLTECDYEDIKEANKIVAKDFIRFADSVCTCIVYDSLVFNSNAIDEIDVSLFENNYIGFIYSDYVVDNKRFFLKSHSANSQINTPMVFWSTEKILKHLSEEDIFQSIYGSYVGVHIPKPLCTVLKINEN